MLMVAQCLGINVVREENFEDIVDAERLSRWRRYRPKPLEELQDYYSYLLATEKYKP